MSKKVNEKTGETQFYIPVDGTYYETDEVVHETYYKMDRRERYLGEVSEKKELSYNALEEAAYPIEMKMREQQETLEEQVVTASQIEKMLLVLQELSEKDKWIIDELFFKGKSAKELARELGTSRTSLQSRKTRALQKIRKMMIEQNHI
jgi:RNA polymerase sigma factor (sigma-70 family)